MPTESQIRSRERRRAERAAKAEAEQELSEAFAASWQPRPIQAEILGANERYKVAVLHRRAGKTEMAVKWLVDGLEEGGEKMPRVVYLGATLKSAKNIAWSMVRARLGTSKFIKYNDWDLSVEIDKCKRFPSGGHLQLLSATNYQNHRGVYVSRLVLDEVDLIPPSAFNAVFRPALADPGINGKALFIGTPLGRGHLFDRFNNADKSPLWASWLLNAEESGLIEAEELADLKATMPREDYLRELMVDFDVAAAGSFYAKQMNAAKDSGRIMPLVFHESEPVTASWYFGKRDDVVVTFWQKSGKFVNCFDAIWKQQTDIDELIEEIDARGFVISRHIAPGDMSKGPGTRLDQARSVGVRLKLAKKLDFMDRIYSTKPQLSTFRFDAEKCADVIEGLRQYRAEYDELKRTYEEHPVNDWTTGFAGSVEVFATDYNPKRSDWSKPIIYPTDRLKHAA